MAATLKPLASGQLSNTEGTLYTTPGSTETTIVGIILHNTDSSEVSDVEIKTRISADDRIIIKQDLGAGYTCEFNQKVMLAAADLIRGSAGTDAVIDYTIFGLEKS